MNEYVRVELINFPNFIVNEAVTSNDDGGYTVFINANITYEAQRLAYLHAMTHIMRCDFDNFDVQRIETCAHEKENML